MAYRQYYLATQKSMYRVPLQPDISNVLNGEVWATLVTIPFSFLSVISRVFEKFRYLEEQKNGHYGP
jgi:hypothetical protein